VSVREIEAGRTAQGWRAMSALRASAREAGPEGFARRVDEVQRPEGYRLAGAFEDGSDEAVAVAGFRLGHNLAWGRFLYVDDLVTLPQARGHGHAGALLDWVLEEARRLGCDEVHLDSGVQPERWDAHRLYLNRGYAIASHHFQRPVDRTAAQASASTSAR
jgi:GNAT superfamily N-acetyltransferase